MQPSYLEISKIFSNDERFTVPLFQRPYVWSREDQWEPLWADVMDVVARLEARTDNAKVASHFLGTIVLEQKMGQTGSLSRREVIDGQQRLTTLQILLKAIGHAIHSKMPAEEDDRVNAWKTAARLIERLTGNEGSGEERYKVWPTNEDRKPFQVVMDAEVKNNLDQVDTRMAAAYRFFRTEAESYLASADQGMGATILVSAIRDHMKLIVLDLERDDEPQAIFETLNAHGTPLLPADLIKNRLLMKAEQERKCGEALYDRHWRQFDKDHGYWREIVGKGHAARPRVDTFLQHWLTKVRGELISPKHIYDRFLRYEKEVAATPTEQGIAATLMGSIQTDAMRFQRLDRPVGNGRFDIFLARLKTLDMVVFHPLLLAAMEGHEDDPDALDRFGRVLESYLVRRMVCGKQTRGYGTIGLKLLQTLKDSVSEPAEAIRDELLRSEGTEAWPNDEDFRREWTARRFYWNLRRDRVAMILKAIEQHYQADDTLSEPLADFRWDQLEIEHVMPQAWQANWFLPEGVLVAERSARVDNIGNLTLVRGKLNRELSNAPWIGTPSSKGKRDVLNDYAAMHLNRRLLKHYWSDWNDETIKNRAEELFEIALMIWPK